MPLIFQRSGMPPFVPVSTPILIQQASNQWPGQSANGDPQSLTETLTLPGSVTAGNSIVVFAITYNLGQTGHTVTISDSQGNTWPAAAKFVDDLVENLSWFVFCLPRLSSGGTGYTITGHYDLLEWQGLWMTEWSGLAASPVIDKQGQVQTASGASNTWTDQLSTGTALAGGANTGVVIAVCHNTTDANAATGGGVGAPNTGTGWTAANSGIIDWNGEENEFVGFGGACEYTIYSTAMGSITPTFSPKKGSENYLTLAIALKAV